MKVKDYGVRLQKLREEREHFLGLISSLDRRVEKREITRYQRQFTINSITHGLSEQEYLRHLENEISEYTKLARTEQHSPALYNILVVSIAAMIVIILLIALIIPEMNRLNAGSIKEFNIPLNKTYYANGQNANRQNVYNINLSEDAPITSLRLNGSYKGTVRIYLVVNSTSQKYLVFDSRKYDSNIISVTGNLFVIRGDPGLQGISLNNVCEETCKIEMDSVDSKDTYLSIEVSDGGFLKIDDITYSQKVANKPPVQTRSINNIMLVGTSSGNVDMSQYFTDVDSSKLYYTLSNVPDVRITTVGNIVTFHTQENLEGNYSGFLYVSDGKDKINSNVFHIIINTTFTGSPRNNIDNISNLPENDKDKNALKPVQTGKTVDVNSPLSNRTTTDNSSLSNRTAQSEVENALITKYYQGFAFHVDPKLMNIWDKNPSATPRVLITYKQDNKIPVNTYLKNLREELDVKKNATPSDFNRESLVSRKNELNSRIAQLSSSVSNAPTANNNNNNNNPSSLITGNLIIESSEPSTQTAGDYSNDTQLAELESLQAELDAIDNKINTLEVYELLLNQTKDANGEYLNSELYVDNSSVEAIDANYSDIKLIKLNSLISGAYLDEPVESLMTESFSITRIPEAKLYPQYPQSILDGTNITICMLDTGIDSNVVKNEMVGYNFVDDNDSNNFSDDNGHGTAMGYILYNMVPKAKLVIGKVLDKNARGYESQVLSGLEYCAMQNASIISMSIGSGGYDGYCDDNPVAQYVNELDNKGILVIAASGNNASTFVKAPACARKALAVGASTKNDTLAEFTSYNGNILLVAPGKNIHTLGINNIPVTISGTSISVPFVAGTAAILREYEEENPIENISDYDTNTSRYDDHLKDIIIHTGQVIEYTRDNITQQFSRLDAFNAISANYTNTLEPANITAQEYYNGTYDGLSDTIPPTYSLNGTNNTAAGQQATFSIYINDETALDPNGTYIFSTNNTGIWVNDSAVNFTATPQWANVTKTLNSTIGLTIGYKWYITDNAGNTNETPIYTLTTTGISGSFAINITTDNDDGEIDGTPFGFPSGENGTTYFGEYPLNKHNYGYFRFQLPTNIPGGATITGAYLDLYENASWTWNVSNGLRIYAENSSNAAQVASAQAHPDTGSSPRKLTNTSARWPSSGGITWTIGSRQNSTDLSPLIQEVVNNYGGLSQNSYIQIWITKEGLQNITEELGTADYNGSPTNSARFYINYMTGPDTIPPRYSQASANNTVAGQSTLFSINVSDNLALQPGGQYTFSTNNTGIWVNDTPITFTTTPSWANVTKVLNSTAGLIIGYKWYFTDNAANTNETPIYTLTSTQDCGTLNTPNSVYTLSGNVASSGTCFTISAENVTLDCQGYTITYSTSGTASNYGVYTNKFNTTVQNCNILDGNWTSANGGRSGIVYSSASNGAIQNNIVNNSNGRGIYLSSATNTILTNNTVSSDSNYGIQLHLSSNNALTRNIISSNSSAGIDIESSSDNTLTSNIGTSASSLGIVIETTSNNILINNIGTSNANTGIYLYASNNSILTNNNGTSNASYGIYIYSSSNNNTLTGNIGTSNSGGGIYIYSNSNNNSLTNNIGTSNASYGICLYTNSNNNILMNNIGTSNTSQGIRIDSSSNNILTSNNGTSNTSYGIYIYSNSNNNILTSNIGTSNTSSGILVQSSLNNNLTSNMGTSISNMGIYISSSSNNSLTNNIGTSNANSGIYITSSANNTLINNTGTSNIDRGIFLYLNSNNNTLISNTGISNSSYGINIYSSSDNTLTSNTGISNSSAGIVLYLDSNNLTNNTGKSNSNYGIYVASSNNSVLTSNTGISNSSIGIQVYLSSNNTLTNNTGTSNTSQGIRIESSSNNILTSNNGTSNTSYGIYIYSNSNNNTLTGNIGTSNTSYGVYLYSSINNILTGQTALSIGSSGANRYAIYIQNSSNTTFQDCVNISGITGDVYIQSDIGSLNNTFLNCSYNTSKETITSTDGQITRKWYFDANVTNSTGNPIQNVNIILYNVTGIQAFSALTDGNGDITRTAITEYINTGGARSYYSNYTISTSQIGYYTNSTTINITALQNTFNTITLQNNPYTLANCTTLSTANSTYTLQNNVTSSGTCFTIAADNVTLDCAGYTITYSTDGTDNTHGIYTTRINTTVQNCNIVDGNWTSSNAYRMGILYLSASNGTIINNIVNISNGRGISIEAGSQNNNIINNTARSDSGTGVLSHSSSNNTFINNTAISNSGTGFNLVNSNSTIITSNNGTSNSSYGIYITSSSNNTLLNNIGTSDSNNGIRIESSSNNILTSNNGTSNTSVGISIYSSSNNNILNNNTGTSSSLYAIYLYISTNNTITGETALSLGSSGARYGIYIRNSSNTTFQDCVNISGITGDVYIQSDTGSTNNIFINCSYNTSKETVASSDGQIIRKWYFDANVTNNASIPIQNANITLYNITSGQVYTASTDSNGDISRTTLTEYTNNGGVKTYETPHTINTSRSGYYTNSTAINITTLQNTFQTITLQDIHSLTNCAALAANTIYILSSNISINGATCLNVTGQNVTIECSGYAIIGNDSNNTYGVYSNQYNTTTQNCNIQGFMTGVRYDTGANNGLINNVNSTTTQAYNAILIFTASGVTISNSRGNSSLSDAVYIYADYAKIYNVTGYSVVGSGIRHYDGSYNIINNITGTSNSSNGVYIFGRNTNASNINASSYGSAGLALDGNSDNFTNVNAYSFNGYGIYMHGNNMTMSNITANSTYGYGVYLDAVTNSTISDIHFISSGGGIEFSNSASYNNLFNINITAQSSGLWFYNSPSNNASNITLNASTGAGLYLQSSSNITVNNINTVSNSGRGIYISSSSNTVMSSLTSRSFGLAAIGMEGSSSNSISYANLTSINNTLWINNSKDINLSNINAYSTVSTAYYYPALAIINSTNVTIFFVYANSTSGNAIYLANASNSMIRNNTLATTNSTELFMDSMSANNLFYYNNLTQTTGLYINNSNDTNMFNTSVNGSAQGNFYYGIGLLPVYDISIFDSDSNGWGDGGPSYPVNSINWPDRWSGYGNDYGPATHRAKPKCGDNINMSGIIYGLIENLSINDSNCFNINLENITVDCHGYSISGNNSNYAGIYVNASYTKIRNCNIFGFQTDIIITSPSNYSNISIVNASTNLSNGYSIYLNASNYDSLSNLILNSTLSNALFMNKSSSNNLSSIYAVSTSGISIVLTNSSLNNLYNVTATSNSNNSIYLVNSSSNNMYNITAASQSKDSLILDNNSTRNYFSYNNITSSSGSAVSLAGSSNNTFANCTIYSSNYLTFNMTGAFDNALYSNNISSTDLALFMDANSGYNNISGNLLNGTNYSIKSDGSYNKVYNNTFISTAGTMLYLSASSKYTKAYYNNFTQTTGYYINNSNSTNMFNISVSTVPQGNVYFNITSLDVLDMNGDGWGDTGTNYPLNATTWSSKWIGLGSDYGPATTKFTIKILSSRISPTNANISTPLIGYCNATAPGVINLTYYYTWYKNNAVFRTANTSNDKTSAIELNVDNISTASLQVYDVWNIECFAGNSSLNSSRLNSSSVTIASTNFAVTFTSPTPTDNTITTNNNVTINMSIDTPVTTLSQFIFNWNNTNYSLYDNDLLLMMNFDNLSTFKENSSSTFVYDASKYGNNGTCVGMGSACAWTTGKYGQGMQFNGSGTGTNVKLSNDIFDTVQYGTISAWIKWNGGTSQWQSWFYAGTASFYPALELGMFNNSGTPTLSVWSGGSGAPGEVDVAFTNPTAWHYVVYMANSTGAYYYMDGQLLQYLTKTWFFYNISSGTTQYQIGESVGETAETFNGAIDEFRIYNRSLNASEIKQLYLSNLNKYNSTKWQFITNQTNLSTGSYQYYGYIKDNSSNTAQTETRTITIAKNANCNITFTANNLYLLNNNISINGSTCLNITAQNVTIDCAGYTISGNNTNNTYGIYSNQYNTTIKNCSIGNFYDAIYFNGSSNSAINNVSVSSNSTGIYLSNSSNDTISNNTITSNSGYAVWITGGSNNNKFYNNTLNNPSGTILLISATSGYNTIYYNNFTQTTGYYIDNSNSTNMFNTSVSTVPQGNYYFNITSLNIYDTDSNGWGDSGNNYPLSSTTWSTKWNGLGTDYGPATSNTNAPPVIQSSTILPSPAYTNESLRGYCNATDANGNNVTYMYRWFLNGIFNISNTTTNNTQGVELNVGNISNSSLTVGQNWTLECQANDSMSASNRLNSTTITVQPLIPQIPALVSPANGNTTIHSKQPVLTWNSSINAAWYEINITSNNCAGAFSNGTNINISSSTSNFTPSSDLCLQTEGGSNTYYNWTVRACNAQACSDWSTIWNFSIEPYLAITLINNSVTFPSLQPGDAANTTSLIIAPFQFRNDGNVYSNLTNITINQSMWVNAPLGTQYLKIEAGQTAEINSFNTGTSVMNWINAASTNNNIINVLDYHLGNRSAYVHVLIEVPAQELAGNKTTYMTFNWIGN